MVLNTSPGYLATLVPTVIKTLSTFYPELLEKEQYIQDIINEEEKSFSVLLPRGVKYINELFVNEEKNDVASRMISGVHAFYLYDTLGFPIDLTQLILGERGYKVNMDEFESLMNEQKAKSREKPKLIGNEANFSTIKLGIEQISSLQSAGVLPTNDEWKYYLEVPETLSARITAFVTSSGDILFDPQTFPRNQFYCGVILDNTPFFAESGGQVSDSGSLNLSLTNGGSMSLKVVDVQVSGPYIVHTCVLPSPCEFNLADIISTSVTCSVDYNRRRAISSNHTMTHLLNFALREVLSPNSLLPIDQKGSLVADDKLRFDFSYPKALTKSEIEEIERKLNGVIQQSFPVYSDFTSLRNVAEINGVRAVFGENYPDPVRVVSIGSNLREILENPSRTELLKISIELCGGIHLQNTADALLFRIIDESSSAKGVRRITAVTGDKALQIQANAQKLKQLLENYDQELNMDLIEVSTLPSYANKLTEFQNLINLQSVPHLDRLTMSNQVTDLKKRLNTYTKHYISQDIDKKVRSLSLQGKFSLDQNLHFDIFILSPDRESPSCELRNDGQHQHQDPLYQISDSTHLKRITNELNSQFQNRLSYLLIIEEEGKITCMSCLQPNAIERGLSANEWIESLMKPFNGKGGGKQNLANGSFKYDKQKHPLQFDQLLESANEVMARYEMKMNET